MAYKAVKLPLGRVSFADVFEPVARKGSDKKFYSVMMLFDKKAQGSDAYKKLRAEVKAFAEEEHSKGIPKKFAWPFKKGEDLQNNDTGAWYNGCDEDTVAISLKSKEDNGRPGLINGCPGGKREPITDKADFYSGCWALVTGSLSCYNVDGNKGLNIYLSNIMKRKDDESLSGRQSATEAFGDVEVEDIEDDVDF